MTRTLEDNKVESYAAITFDAGEFAAFVANFDLTEAQQRELLSAVWSVVLAFVDLRFGIHPVQCADASLGLENPLRPESDPMLDSPLTVSTDNALELAGRFAARSREREDS